MSQIILYLNGLVYIILVAVIWLTLRNYIIINDKILIIIWMEVDKLVDEVTTLRLQL